jgi:hypothetical protein
LEVRVVAAWGLCGGVEGLGLGVRVRVKVRVRVVAATKLPLCGGLGLISVDCVYC